MKQLISDAQKYVTHILTNKLDTGFVYHNLAHTQSVVDKTIEIAQLCVVTKKEMNLLTLAAWFHDTGHIVKADGHEKESASIAVAFLKKYEFSSSDIDLISTIILATEITYKPKNLLEKIIRDADCSYVGSDYFISISQLLKQEWELTANRHLSEVEWLEENIGFLTELHSFHTDVAIAKWQAVKTKHLTRLERSLTEIG